MPSGIQQQQAEGINSPIELADDLSPLLDKYPFTTQQLQLLLKLQTLQQSDENDNETAVAFHLSAIIKEPPIQWIEENLLTEPFSDWVQDGMNFFECMAMLTGRKGSPSSELLTIYNTTTSASPSTSTSTTDEDEDEESGKVAGNAAQLVQKFYRLGLACHVIQQWNDDGTGTGIDLETVKKCAEKKNTSMITSLQTFNGEEPVENVDRDTFLNWAELNFPQMKCILSSYIHLALFSFLKAEDNSNTLSTGTPDDDSDGDDGDDSDEDEDEDKDKEPSKLSLYALGNRTMFQFPTLEKLVMAGTSDVHSLAKWKIVAAVDVESALLHNPGIMSEGGNIGHFAFGMVLMDPKLCGKVSELITYTLAMHVGFPTSFSTFMLKHTRMQWHRMYSTETDGFAFLNLQRALTGYAGPTIMLVRPTEASATTDDASSPGLLGFYTANPWNESNRFYGTSDCFLFRAEPTWNVYRPRRLIQEWNFEGGIASTESFPPSRTKENYMYFHPSAGHINNGGGSLYGSDRMRAGTKPRGLVLGGTEQDPRFYITESLERCVASSGGPRDATFESGPLLPGQWDKYFNVDVLEVWGVGGDDVVREAVNARERHEGITDAARRRVQRVDKKQFLEDFQSGLLMGNNQLFKHRTDGTTREERG